MRRYLFVLLGGVVLVAGLSACKQEQADARIPPVVWTVQPHKDRPTSTIQLSGRVVALQQSPLSFQVPGRIVERKVEVGDRVRRGQVLMVIDDRDYRLKVENLQAQISATASDLETARRDLQRLENLLQRKLVSQQQVDNARNRVTRLKAQLGALQPQLAQARNQLAYTRLKAPFSGVVTARQVDIGQVVAPGTSVVTVAAEERGARFDWPETAGQPPQAVMLRFDMQTFTAVLDYISPQADPVSRTFSVRYHLGQKAVPLGRSVQLRVEQAGQPLWRVPLAAVRMEQGQAMVFAVVDDRIQPVKVAVERMDSEHAWVRGPLQPDLSIVSMGVHRLTPGQKVRAQRHG